MRAIRSSCARWARSPWASRSRAWPGARTTDASTAGEEALQVGLLRGAALLAPARPVRLRDPAVVEDADLVGPLHELHVHVARERLGEVVAEMRRRVERGEVGLLERLVYRQHRLAPQL